MSIQLEAALAEEDYCNLTTVGRRTGRPHRIEIWFAIAGQTLYLLAGGGEKADWIRNARKTPQVDVQIHETVLNGVARPARDSVEDALARRLLLAKYQPRDRDDLTNWGRTALPLAIDLVGQRAWVRE